VPRRPQVQHLTDAELAAVGGCPLWNDKFLAEVRAQSSTVCLGSALAVAWDGPGLMDKRPLHLPARTSYKGRGCFPIVSFT
jgi:hypothetical protein